MRRSTPRPLAASIAPLSLVLLAACGGGDGDDDSGAVVVTHSRAGVTPFIAVVTLHGSALAQLAAVHYTIAAKPNAVSKPVDVRFTAAALTRRGAYAVGSSDLALPVFGLYAGYANSLRIELSFADGSTRTLPDATVSTERYVDPNGIYDRPAILVARPAGSALGFDYFAIKSMLGTPVVVDSDGEVRWRSIGSTNSTSTAFTDNGFVVGDTASTAFHRLELDGTVTAGAVAAPGYTDFHHEITAGKSGLLGEFDAIDNGVANVEAIAAEFGTDGIVSKAWDFGALISAYMRGQGDDPTAFVRPGVDWFHLNSVFYDARDDSLIVSSRENFVAKFDYASGDIAWILGDPTKYWYTFPSLRAKALTLAPGGLYPAGQHAVSIDPAGRLLLFNDGEGSANQPSGAPAGETRSYSAVSAYDIDATARTASEAWRFDHGQTIFSAFCSSVFSTGDGSLLVDYAQADGGTHARLVGLDPNRHIVFDFQYASSGCSTAWNSIPVPFDGLSFQ